MGRGRPSNSVSEPPPPPSESTLWNQRFVLASHVFVGFFVFVTFFFRWSNRNLLLLAISCLVGKKNVTVHEGGRQLRLCPHTPSPTSPSPHQLRILSALEHNVIFNKLSQWAENSACHIVGTHSKHFWMKKEKKMQSKENWRKLKVQWGGILLSRMCGSVAWGLFLVMDFCKGPKDGLRSCL